MSVVVFATRVPNSQSWNAERLHSRSTHISCILRFFPSLLHFLQFDNYNTFRLFFVLLPSCSVLLCSNCLLKSSRSITFASSIWPQPVQKANLRTRRMKKRYVFMVSYFTRQKSWTFASKIPKTKAVLLNTESITRDGKTRMSH